jgi:hypothetical protein
MINENIIDLELYAAVQVGQAIGLLERLCEAILERFNRSSNAARVRAYHPALAVLKTTAEKPSDRWALGPQSRSSPPKSGLRQVM